MDDEDWFFLGLATFIMILFGFLFTVLLCTDDKSKTIKYSFDSTTHLCYASMEGNWSNVPCSDEVMKAIKEK